MRLLIITQWYYPEPPGFRTQILADELVRRGHSVVVLTGFPNYPNGKIYPGYKQRLWQVEHINGVKVIRVPLYPDHSQTGLRRALNYLSFFLSSMFLGMFVRDKVDMILAYALPTIGLASLWLSRLRRIPFLFELADMWPENVAASGMLANKTVFKLLNAICLLVYRTAARVIVVSPGFKSNLVEKTIPENKIVIIPNWADESIYCPTDRDPKFGERFGLDHRINILYAGNIGFAQGLESALDAAALLQDVRALQFVLIGDGTMLPILKNKASQMNLSNVSFLGRQPAEEMPRFFAWANALLVPLRDDALFSMTIPSKLIACLAMGRPIIGALAGDGTDLIRQSGAGITCLPANPEDLASHIREFIALSPERLEQMGMAGRTAYLKMFSQQKLIDEYEKLFLQTSCLIDNQLQGE